MVSGLVPVMLPITAQPAGHAAVGFVVASFFVGQLTAPYNGAVADRLGKQRVMFLAAFPVMAVCAVVLGVSDSVYIWILASLLAGAAAGTAQTLGSVFIVEGHPKEQWNTLLGWFRLTFGLGQVVGLAIGGLFASSNLRLGWIIAALIMMLGVFLGRIGLPHLQTAPGHSATADSTVDVTSKQHKTLKIRIQGFLTVLKSRFGFLLVCWFLSSISVLMFLNAMPLVMSDAFEIGSSLSASVYLVGALAGAVAYPAVGDLSRRVGAGRVALFGFLLSFAALTCMAIAFFAHPSWGVAVGLVGMFCVAFSYPYQYIGANLLAATLASGSEGGAMGMFNASAASGAVIGALAPVGLASAFGYGSYLPLAAGIGLLGIVVGIPVLLGKHHRGPWKTTA